ERHHLTPANRESDVVEHAHAACKRLRDPSNIDEGLRRQPKSPAIFALSVPYDSGMKHVRAAVGFSTGAIGALAQYGQLDLVDAMKRRGRRILAHQRKPRDRHTAAGFLLLEARLQQRGNLCAAAEIERAGQGQMKLELVEYVGITPLIEVRDLARAQPG